MGSSKGIYRILVADDDPGMLRLMTFMLNQAGHLVETCEDGAEALAKLAEASYSLLIIDQAMPKMVGSKVIETLRERGEGIPIILASGSLTREIIEPLEHLERVAFLEKPFSSKELISLIQKIAPTVKC